MTLFYTETQKKKKNIDNLAKSHLLSKDQNNISLGFHTHFESFYQDLGFL